MLGLLTFSFFCLLSLGAPDASLLSATAKIKLPFADAEVGYRAFLIIAPLILIILSVYLHIFVGYHRTLENPEGSQGLPFIFNLHGRMSRLLAGFLFYWLVPLVLLVFSWKASPRPEGSLLILLTVLSTMVFVAMAIKRWPTRLRRSGWYRMGYYPLWGMQGLLFYAFVSQVFTGSIPLLPLSRNLNLFKANFADQDLRNTDLSKSDLREANLERANLSRAILFKANLEGAILAWANLEGADLREANLGRTDLRGAYLFGSQLDDTTKIDEHWRLVWKILNKGGAGENFTGDYLARADLGGADLRMANLKGTILVEVKLSKADLERANLEEAKLYGADLEGAILEGAILKRANLEGAKNVTMEQLTEACVDKTTRLPERMSLSELPTIGCRRWRWTSSPP